ncbi:hypothetical protein AYO44_07485 [Planctomycetaceae bacterium SCGC AG-212-F19]|nr:hypothetical protein AYO44_07485 [Planctomycetaceae bacterium SCGC AG-212-F19]
MAATPAPTELESLRDAWLAHWQEALASWSKFTKLSEPRWCFNAADEKREGLSGSFAMIRLTDQAVVVSLRGVVGSHVEKFAPEILAHEIGHHVYVPASVLDHGRMLARIRRGLPTKEHLAPLVANLYADLLLNDRLQRSAGLDIAGVYRTLADGKATSSLWTLYMRIYEILWSLPRGALAAKRPAKPVADQKRAVKMPPLTDDQLEGDAQLGARVIRSYARDWLDGAGKFAVLCLPYLIEDEGETVRIILRGWLDVEKAGDGACIPAGLADIDDGEEEGAIHPAQDPELTGLGSADAEPEEGKTQEPALSGTEQGPGRGRNLNGGQRKYRDWRGPIEYGEILKAMGSKLSDHEITIRYYRERAVPHLIRFPTRQIPETTEPLPEGLENWDFGMPLEDADWLQSVMVSPHVIPGMTTVQRTYGATSGSHPEKRPVDLYLGVDCSGSMLNPQRDVSYPVLAGAIIAMSALRTGSRVMVVLSGEPGRSVATDGFIANEHAVLEVLTGYLGTGYTFGIHRLNDTFGQRKPADRDVHILIVTDHDIFQMLDETKNRATGWEVAKESVERARGGGTYVMHMPADWEKGKLQRMRATGWQVHCVQTWEELVAFAQAFSQAHYGEKPRERRRPAP